VDDARAMASYPAPIVVEPGGGDANAAMILLHGLGDTGRGWAGAAQQIPAPAGANVRWVFPTAKTMPVTLNGGMRMTAWFDLNALDERSIVDDRGEIDASVEYLNALVREQMDKGIPSDRILIGGFSQGGAIALTAALRSEVKLAGCVAMSTYLPLRADYPDRFGAHARSLKILQAHGTSDMVLQYSYGKMSAELMQAAGVDVDFKTYNGMAHSACAEEFDDVADFLKARLAG
jgi:lysophospholipase-2